MTCAALCAVSSACEQLGSLGGDPFACSTRGLRAHFYFCEAPLACEQNTTCAVALGAPSLHRPWHPAETANAARALTLPLPISPCSGAAVPRPSQCCVVPAAGWLLLCSIHALGAWRSHSHCQEQLGPPSWGWELVIIIYPGLWKCFPVTWLKTRLSTCILGECKGWSCFVYIWALVSYVPLFSKAVSFTA